jgi:demethylmenaquinone methyltransferase/2-methoxy-6-polyprenyl-1,4-benzoquinol methylase
VVLEFDEPRNPLIRAANRLYTHRIMPVTASLIARDRSGAYRYLPRSVETFLDRDRLREALLSVGFTDVRQTPLTFGTCVVTVAR